MIVNFVFPIHSIARRRLPARLSAGAALTRAGQHMTRHNASAISDSPPNTRVTRRVRGIPCSCDERGGRNGSLL